MSSSFSILSEVNGRPACWDWNISEITQYIRNHQGQAYRRYLSENSTDTTRHESFTRLLNQVLLRCLQSMSVYSYSDRAMRHVDTCLVSFHLRKQEVPIADVYSALGWFISYSEDPIVIVSDDAPLFVLYTRLCRNIAEEIRTNTVGHPARHFSNNYEPAKTHMFWVGTFPILTADLSEDDRGPVAGSMRVLMSLSATLPRANTQRPNGPNPKNVLKAARDQMIGSIIGPTIKSKMDELNSGHVGVCAETLNYASFANKDATKATIGFGFALTTKDVRGRFTSYAEIIRKAHCQACESCRELFIHGRVTQQDFASGRVCGPFPHGTNPPESWREKNPPMCKHCHNPITEPRNKTEYCSLQCRNDYANFRERAGGNYPPSHQVASWNTQGIPGPSTSVQGYIPATAGYPPSVPQGYEPVAQQWSFYAPPDVNPIPSWAHAHPDRIHGNPQYQPPY